MRVTREKKIREKTSPRRDGPKGSRESPAPGGGAILRPETAPARVGPRGRGFRDFRRGKGDPPPRSGETVGDAAPDGNSERRREASILGPEISISSTKKRPRVLGTVVEFFSGRTAASRGAATRDPVALPPPREADPGSRAFLPSRGPLGGELRISRLRSPAPSPKSPRRGGPSPVAPSGPPSRPAALPARRTPVFGPSPARAARTTAGFGAASRCGYPCAPPRNYFGVL